MAYDNAKGNFYHENGDQVLDDVQLKNANAVALPEGSTISGVAIIKSETVPTTLAAEPGTICVVVTTDGAVSTYIQEGTKASPDWNKVTTV